MPNYRAIFQTKAGERKEGFVMAVTFKKGIRASFFSEPKAESWFPLRMFTLSGWRDVTKRRADLKEAGIVEMSRRPMRSRSIPGT